ncbi:hypothetical protein ACIP5Y_07555 [Nocardia sp. NPDC088792]|uniref:hypothetical protein n=1 Tax=Nocardia sp. NPDC088792 TaxID=3364332 RepID=UPI0038162ACC
MKRGVDAAPSVVFDLPVEAIDMDPWIHDETDPTETIQAELLAAHGPDWPTELLRNLRFDPNVEPVELPALDEEIAVVRKVFLRLPYSVDEQFQRIGRQRGLTPSELVSAWIGERVAGEPHDTIDKEARSSDLEDIE